MIKKFNIYSLIVILFILPLIFTQNSSSDSTICQINISSSANSTGVCGYNNGTNIPCQTFSQGIQSCFNQTLTKTMEFTFDNETFYFSPNEVAQLNEIYNQSITLVGSGATIIDLSQTQGILFNVLERAGSLVTDVTSIQIGFIKFQNYRGTTGSPSIQSIFGGSIFQSTLNVLVQSSSFSNMNSNTGTVFNLQTNVAGSISLTVQNTQFNSIIASTSSAIVYSQGPVALTFEQCVFNGISAPQSSIVFGQHIASLRVINSQITFSQVTSDQYFCALFYIYSQNTTSSLPNLFQNNTFSKNKPNQSNANYVMSLIKVQLGSVTLNNNTFTNNAMTPISLDQANGIITNNIFYNNIINSPLIYAQEESTVQVTDSTFTYNTLVNSASYSLIDISFSTLIINNSNITANTGPLFSIINSGVSLNNIDVSPNGNGLVEFISDCSLSNITINGNIPSLSSSSATINCQQRCNLTSTNKDYSCPSESTPTDNKKRDFIIGICVAAAVLILIIIIIVIVRRYRHHHHHYHSIDSHHHHHDHHHH